MPLPLPDRREFCTLLGAAPFQEVLAGTEQADPARELKPSRSDLGTLFPEVNKLAQSKRFRLSFLEGSFMSFAECRQTGRSKVLELLQYQPAKVDPRPEVVEKVDCEDHIREKILFSTSEFFRVPAYVLIPKNRRRPAPAVVDLHSHGGMFLFGKEKVIDFGKNHPVMSAYHQRNYDGRPTSTALVRRGYVVIVIDAFLFGERRILMDADLERGWDRSRYSADIAKKLNDQCRAKETTVAKALTFAGATWPGIVFWDDMRTVDYLVTRPEVDPKRIGCLGISMGGYRTMFLAGLDDRIKAACVTGFMSTVHPMIQAHIDTHSWVHFLPGLHAHLDWPDVAALTAPRALMVQQCLKDRLFPLSGMKDSVNKIAKIYDKAGCKDRFAGRFYDAPHQFTKKMQQDAFAWLDKHLDHKPIE